MPFAEPCGGMSLHPEAEIAERPEGTIYPSGIERVSHSREKHTILIVDDEERLRKALARSLSEGRCRVLAVASAEEALMLMIRERVDLVISDLIMPGMGGVMLSKSIKDAFPDVEIIILTAYGSAESRRQAEEIGVAGYLEKPFDLNYLKLKVHELLPNGKAVLLSSCSSVCSAVWKGVCGIGSVGANYLGTVTGLFRNTLSFFRLRNVLLVFGRAAGTVTGLMFFPSARRGRDRDPFAQGIDSQERD